MHIGFTGTRKGMSPAQLQRLHGRLLLYAEAEGEWDFHHGDCQGADAQAHDIAWMLGAIVHIHPPAWPTMRAYCGGSSRVIRYAPRPFLRRNHDIVDACELLLAAPWEPQEIQRSGTWATIRYARKQGKPVYLLLREEPQQAAQNDNAAVLLMMNQLMSSS